MTETLHKLRPVTEDDIEFLYDVYADSRSIELSVMPWTDEQKRIFVVHQYTAQTTHYREYYPRAAHDIVLHNDKPVGRLYVDRGEKVIAILDLCIAIKDRRRGIASSLLSDLISEAQEKSAVITVSTEPFNPSQSLFRKLGFQVANEDEVRVSFEWRPKP